MNFIKVLIIIAITSLSLSAQVTQLNIPLKLENAVFDDYNGYQVSKEIYPDNTNLNQSTPEETLKFFISSLSREEIINIQIDNEEYVYKLSPTEKERRSKMHPSLNYVDLFHKLSFTYKNEEIAIIKFNRYINGNRSAGSEKYTAFAFKKKGDKWYFFRPKGELLGITNILRKFKTKPLYLLLGQRSISDESLKRLSYKCRGTGGRGINLSCLVNTFNDWNDLKWEDPSLKLFFDKFCDSR